MNQMRAEVANIDALVSELSATEAVAQRRLRAAKAPERMTIAAAARYLGSSRTTVYRRLAEGVLTGHPSASGRRYLLKSEIDRWLLSTAATGGETDGLGAAKT